MENVLEEHFSGFVIPHQVLLSPGTWNGKYYSADEIEKSYKMTDWSDPSVTTLIADHSDDDVEHLPRSIHDWEGNVENLSVEDGILYGDVRIFDLNSIYKLRDGKMKAGISVKVSGDNFNNNVCNFAYKNFSLVVNPACKEAYLKLSDKEKSEKGIFLILNEIDNKFSENNETTSNSQNHISENNSESIQMKGGSLLEEKMAEEEKKETSEMPKDEAKKEEEKKSEVKSEEKKSEEKMSEEELSEEQILSRAIEILQKKKKPEETPMEKPVEKCSEDTRLTELSAKVEKLEQMITEKLSEITQRLSEKTTEKLSESNKVSKTYEKLSAEVRDKFSMNNNSISKGTLDFASSLLDKYSK